MGGNFSCRSCNQCRHCSLAKDRCQTVCLGYKNANSVVQSHMVASGSSTLPQDVDRYPLAGMECSAVQRVCGDFGQDQDSLETICDVPKTLDQVLPMPPIQSDGGMSAIPNIGEKKAITTLEDECRFNAGKLEKIRHLAESYMHWRPIRGDGNCYYRTVVFGALEALLDMNALARVQNLIQALSEVRYELPVEQDSHEKMVRCLRSWNCLKQLEAWVANDCAVDEALVRACRRLVRLFLIRHADKISPNGLTYSELARALDTAYTNMEDFCMKVVDPMGRDAETLALDALPRQLGIGVRLWILDRRNEVDLVNVDTLSPLGEVDVHMLFKPGHYDLLYPRQTAVVQNLAVPFRENVSVL